MFIFNFYFYIQFFFFNERLKKMSEPYSSNVMIKHTLLWKGPFISYLSGGIFTENPTPSIVKYTKFPSYLT